MEKLQKEIQRLLEKYESDMRALEYNIKTYTAQMTAAKVDKNKSLENYYAKLIEDVQARKEIVYDVIERFKELKVMATAA